MLLRAAGRVLLQRRHARVERLDQVLGVAQGSLRRGDSASVSGVLINIE